MNNVEIALDAISKLTHIINTSDDNEWSSEICNTIEKTNSKSKSTMDVAMTALKNQINIKDHANFDITSNLLANTSNIMTKSGLEFEKTIYNQLITSNRNYEIISYLKHLLDDIRNDKNNKNIPRAINLLNVINDQPIYKWGGNFMIYIFFEFSTN